MNGSDTVVLGPDEWIERAQAHRRRVEALIGPYLAARRRGATNPVLDFLFTYYPYRPALLKRWHPGFGIVISDRDGRTPYDNVRGYRRVDGGATASLDYLNKRRTTLSYTASLLAATAARPARMGCFGLHEWAMVYRAADRRHPTPLRLGADGTDAVVESMSLQCTHFDAFRFFTEEAVERNSTPLSRETQIDFEQPGCLHASMDLYRLTAKLMPLVDSEVLLDTFVLAYDARELDMRASPYDLRRYGYEPVQIETPDGRAEYVRAQAVISERGATLRTRLFDRVDALKLLASS